MVGLSLFSTVVFSRPPVIVNNGGTIEIEALPHGMAEMMLEIPSGGNRNWSITTGQGLHLDAVGTSLVNGVTQVKLIYKPTSVAPACPANIAQLTLVDPMGGPSITCTIRACIVSAIPTQWPISLAMVVDVSGSMNDPANCPAAPASTKIKVLKQKAKALYESLSTHFTSAGIHRFGLFSFSDNARTEMPMTLFTNGLAPTFNGYMDENAGLIAGGGTSMGAGLRAAVDSLGGVGPVANQVRVIILLTNGMQNTSPMVNAAGNGIEGVYSLVGTDILIIPYAIFTPNDAYMTTLHGLTALNGNTWGVTTTPFICDITEGMQQAWVGAATATQTPKTVGFRKGQLTGNTGTEIFQVKEEMDELTMYVSSAGTLNYTQLKIEQKVGSNFVDVTASGTITPALSTPSPHRIWRKTAVLGITGEYRMTFTSNQPNAYYDASSIVDDRDLKQAFFATPVVAAGEPIYLGALLKQGNAPVTDATVKAYLYAPKKALHRSFAQKKVPARFISTRGAWQQRRNLDNWFGKETSFIFTDPKVRRDGYVKQISITHPTLPSFKEEGDRMKIGEKKYLVLLNETNFREVYEQELVATVPLVHEGNGVYRAQYNDTKKPGLYHVRIEAEGTHPQIGAYKRFEDKTPLVRFGTPDLRRSCLFILYDQPHLVMMRPVDIHGNVLGPNQVEAITVKIGNYSVRLVDYLDGRYVFPADINTNQTLYISINDRLLYRGPLSGLPHKRWFIGAHGGLSTPTGAAALTLKTGYYGGLTLGRQVYQNWYAQLKGGYYHWTPVGTDHTLPHAMASVGIGAAYRQFFYAATGFYAQAEANVAAYKKIDGDWSTGLNMGASVIKPLSHFLYASLDFQYHQTGQTAPANFNTLGIGLHYRFGGCRPKAKVL